MTKRVFRKSDIAIGVFYPGSSLMHQSATWASGRPGASLEVSFADSTAEIRAVLQKADVAIVDATEDPGRAMEAFVRAAVEPTSRPVRESRSVAVYSETMHRGLELFVRSRGALLLWGPLRDEAWYELFDAMMRLARHVTNSEAPWRQRKDREIGAKEGRPSTRRAKDTTRRSKDTAGDEFRRSA